MTPAGRGILLVFSSILLFLSFGQVAGADAALPADVLIGVFPQGPDREGYRSVIASAVSYKLESLGLQIAFLPAGAGDGEVDAQAKKGGEPATLKCRYSADNGRLLISFAWHEVGASNAPVESRESGALDLHADAVILRALDSLVAAVHPEIDRLAQARAAASSVSRAPPETPNPIAAVPAPGGPAVVLAPGAPAGPAVGPASAGPTYPSSAPPRRVALTSGFAPFIAFGPASAYFSVGLLPSILASMQFQTAGGRFAVGIYAAMNAFTANGLIDTASSYLIPLGPDLRYEVGSGKPFVVYAHVCGGPALLLMNTGAQGTLFDVTEFVKSGLGAEVMITSRVGISIEADYEVYFEMPYLIMGFSPTALLTLLP